MSFANKVIRFCENLKSPQKLPGGVEVLNPSIDLEIKNIVKEFYLKYYNDNHSRIYLFGINPGRFGGGLTGIPFTDPVALEEFCGIKNSLDKKRELSSKFIYRLIDKYGGAKKFYSKIFVTALYPLALLKQGKNYNYYDNAKLYSILKPQIISLLKEQISFGAKNNFAISLGRKNAKYLIEINSSLNFFKQIKVLDHPRYIMQYRLKSLNYYVDTYLQELSNK
ncbi:MAG: DUF4918 family protein [Nitrososphaeraceae archaeon]|nr:DUF4918 family protein [Nitrososphaeraceae archaeon]